MRNNLRSILKTIANLLLISPILLVTNTVFVVDYDFANPTVAPKYSWFAVSLLLSCVSALFLVVINKKSIKLTIPDLLISVFCWWGILLTYYLYNDFTLRLNLLLALWIFYCVCRITISQYKHFPTIIFFTLLITGFVEALWGLGQLYGYLPSQHNLFKTTGSFYNSGPYAGYLSVILPIALYYLLFDYQSVKERFKISNLFFYIRWIFSCLTFLLIIIVLPATMSRASWLAAFSACGFVITTYIYDVRKKDINLLYEKFKKYSVYISMGVILLISLTFGGMYYLKKDSAEGRTLMWKTSIAAIQKRPEGAGIGHFSQSYGTAQIDYFRAGKASLQEQLVAGSPEYAFNEYLQIGIEFGVIPLLIFFFLIFYTLFIGYKKKNYAAMSGLLALLIFAFMSYPFNLLTFLIILVLLIILTNYEREHTKEYIKVAIVNMAIIICLLTAILITTICKRHPLHHAYQEWSMVKMLNNAGIDEKQADTYERLYPLLNHESRFLFEYAQCLNRLERYEKSNRVLEKMTTVSCDPMIYNVMGRNYQAMKKYDEAEKSFQTASSLIPSRIYPYYLLTKLYDETGEQAKALSMARIVQTKEPKVYTEAINEMREEVNIICKKYKSE